MNAGKIISDLKILKCQSMIRGWLSRKNNIYLKLKKSNVSKVFSNEFNGYHLICEAPVKEALWEEINKNIVSTFCNVSDEAKGNHKSGKDMQFDKYGISIKSSKIERGKISISSYRLTTICSDKNPGNPEDIVNEIKKRDSSYEYYSILAREELENNSIHYYWLLIPKNTKVFEIKLSNIRPKIGKFGKNKDNQVGWETDNSSIVFSMSSQLWFNFNFESIKKYIIADVIVDNSKKKKTYSEIFNILNNT